MERLQQASSGCDRGDGNACAREGRLQLDVHGNRERAVRAFHRGCSRNAGNACFELARVHLHGAQTNEERAVYYLKRACTLESAQGCRKMAQLHAREGDWHNPDKAAHNLQRACELGLPVACDEVRSLAARLTKRNYSVREVRVDGLLFRDITCGIQSERSFALAEQVKALAAKEAGIARCGVKGSVSLQWTWRLGKTASVRIDGITGSAAACIERTVRSARFLLDGQCRGRLAL